jgi:predicted AAA+ superfamily ATPase
MIHRNTTKLIREALGRQAAVAIIGPRQVGKTTLALEIAAERPSLYLDLESRSDRGKLSDPVLFLRAFEDQLVVLDEIHRAPDLFADLRGLIDQGRRAGKGTGRFLILGSAAIDLLRQSSESLAGRIEYIELEPLNCLEISTDIQAQGSLWVRGGFPQSYLAKNDQILDGGSSQIGIESTIIDCTKYLPVILRPGYITSEMVESFLPLNLAKFDSANNKVMASGLLEAHYLNNLNNLSS